MNGKQIELLLLLLLIFNFAYSSNNDKKDEKKNKGIFTSVELGMYKGIKLSPEYPNALADRIETPANNAFTKSLRLIFGYFINPKISLGVGFGADRFENYGANTFPLFLDLRGYLKDSKNTPFVFFDLGKTVVFSPAQENGNLFDGGVGYKFFVGKKTCVNAKVGYNYFKEKEWEIATTTSMIPSNPGSGTGNYYSTRGLGSFLNLKRHSISFSIGILF